MPSAACNSPRPANKLVSSAANRCGPRNSERCLSMVVISEIDWFLFKELISPRTGSTRFNGGTLVRTSSVTGRVLVTCTYGRYQTGRSILKLNRSSLTSSTNPTTVYQGVAGAEGLPGRTRLPSGDSPGHSRFANSLLTTTTGRVSA